MQPPSTGSRSPGAALLVTARASILRNGSKHLDSSAAAINNSLGPNTRLYSSSTQTAPADLLPHNCNTSYSIAIPSYNRAHTLKQRTLSALQKVGVDCRGRVHIFVANEHEAAVYKDVLPPGSYASIVTGTIGIGRQRDFILDYFGTNSKVVMLDDDIVEFRQLYDGPVNLHKAIETGFQLCETHNCYLWGINNSSNVFHMRPTYTVGWCFFQGPFMGFRVRAGLRLEEHCNDILEDAQYSLMHCEVDNKVLRLNGIGLKARPYGKEPGGLQAVMDRQERQARASHNKMYLLMKYGKFIRDWSGHRPHPSMCRSPQHQAIPLDL
eukprot:gene9248-9414_t